MKLLLTMFAMRDVPTGPVFGLFCAVGAIAMGHQTIDSYRKGYMYCGITERVYRKENPIKFKFWFVIQTFFVLFLTTLTIYSFLN